MGQGVYTSIAMILAEELDAAIDHVTLEHAPPSDKLYGNPIFGLQATGGSTSHPRLLGNRYASRLPGARALLVQAASEQLKVPVTALRTENSEAIHDASGQRVAYSALIARAQTLSPPKDPAVKDPKDFRLIGKPLKRFDTPGKVNGQVVYGIDAMPPGVKFATLAASPVFGGKVGHVDDGKPRRVPGVRQVLVFRRIRRGGRRHMWAAKLGLAALEIAWAEGANAQVSSADIWNKRARPARKEGVVVKNDGDAAKSLAQGEVFAADYELPFSGARDPGAAELHRTRDTNHL